MIFGRTIARRCGTFGGKDHFLNRPPVHRAVHRAVLAAAVAAAPSVLGTPSTARGTTIITYPFRGVKHYDRTEEAGVIVPRRVVMHLLEVDLNDPTITFDITPSNGTDLPGEVTGGTTREWVTQVGAQ